MGDTRLDKSLRNAKINLAFFALIIFVNFFSRSIFIKHLGDEFVGIISVIFNILNVINLAELGIGSVVGFMLYKPLFDKDTERIKEIISVFGYLYNRIGLIVLGVTLLFSPFLPFFFKESTLPLGLIYFSYFSFVTASLLGYFFNYKQTLLWADQKQYEVTAWTQLSTMIKICIQMLIARYTQNLVLWVVMELIFAVVYSIIITKRVNKIYPYLKTSIRQGKILLKDYGDMIKYVKQIFVHKLGGVVLTNTSPIFVYMFTSATLVVYFTNYTLIITKLQQLISHLFSSIDAGVGSVVAEGKDDMIQRIYFEISSLYFFISGVMVAALYFCVNPFIEIWLGAEYILSGTVVVLLLVNLFMSITRIATDCFISAYGLFYDMWAPITEASLNIVISVVCGIYWGIEGVLLGTTVSIFLIVHLWKPYFLFTKGMKINVWRYWRSTLSNTFYIGATFLLFKIVIVPHITLNAADGYINWIGYGAMVTSCYGTILLSVMYLFSQGMRNAVKRIILKLLKKNGAKP